jgi:hypothetical protein
MSGSGWTTSTSKKDVSSFRGSELCLDRAKGEMDALMMLMMMMII